MKLKKYIVEIKKETGLKNRPEVWDLFVPTNSGGHYGNYFYSRNEARLVIRKLNIGRGEARLTKLDRFKGEMK